MHLFSIAGFRLGKAADQWRLQPWVVAVATASTDLLAVLLPTSCVVCGAADHSLCPSCRRTVRRSGVRPYFAQGAAEMLPRTENQPHSGPGTAGENEPEALPVVAAGRYAGSLARVLLAYKNQGHTDLAEVLRPLLAGALHQAVHPLCSRELVLVPVPGTGRAMRRRGYHPLGMLLGALSSGGLLPAGTSLEPLVSESPPGLKSLLRPQTMLGVVIPGKPGGSQKGLGRQDRRANVYGTMTAGAAGSLVGRRCLVVDDVLTTGATIAETTRALRAAGARVEAAVVIAATAAPACDAANTTGGS